MVLRSLNCNQKGYPARMHHLFHQRHHYSLLVSSLASLSQVSEPDLPAAAHNGDTYFLSLFLLYDEGEEQEQQPLVLLWSLMLPQHPEAFVQIPYPSLFHSHYAAVLPPEDKRTICFSKSRTLAFLLVFLRPRFFFDFSSPSSSSPIPPGVPLPLPPSPPSKPPSPPLPAPLPPGVMAMLPPTDAVGESSPPSPVGDEPTSSFSLDTRDRAAFEL
ncbi:hypothetical protein J437_LFUL006491 [Ladona fulva]|uniref:Uncharacterized protein n=1 Tax=Ladona fulva TaxID=123851 RepID=A0A8K0NZ73_LADFU|nr:hypothetical protein J437_LFUL006491 [Ladona fulva]